MDSSQCNFRKQESEWVQRNKDAYADLWVAVEGDLLIASGADGRRVYDEARAAGIDIPFLVHIPPKDELPFGGW